jgi:hypothetical protein
VRPDLGHLGPEFRRNFVWKIPFFWTFVVCPSEVRSHKNLCICRCTVVGVAGWSEAPARTSAGGVRRGSSLSRLFCCFFSSFRIFSEARALVSSVNCRKWFCLILFGKHANRRDGSLRHTFFKGQVRGGTQSPKVQPGFANALF